jgi:FemAB-related protein (PEP-CTERM system-associated)
MLGMNVRVAEDADQSNWDGYVLGHEGGTAYQLWGWSNAIERSYGFRRLNLLAESGGRIYGVLPAIDFRLPVFGKKILSLPYCDAGGVLADNESVAKMLLDKVLLMAINRGACCLIRSNISLPVSCENTTDKVRMVLELPESTEKLLAGLKSKLRSQVKKPMRDGLRAKIGSEELLSGFYHIFAENMRDLGSPVHSRKFIEAVIKEYGERARIGLVYTPEGVPSAAGIILLHSTTVSIPWASSLRRHNSLNPNMLLYWTFLSFAVDNGYKRFDFGRSSPGEGTWRFKEQWGALPHPLFWYELKTKNKARAGLKGGAVSIRCRPIIAAFWSRLPLVAAARLGPKIRKYISL